MAGRHSLRSFSQIIRKSQGTSTHRTEQKVWTRLPGTLELESGGTLDEVVIPWEHWGDPSLPKVLLMPSFSHGSHAKSSPEDPTPGWWERMVGPGLFIDTNKFHVICPSFLGSPYDGTTSPLTPAPNTDYPRGRDFPQSTPGDLARCHARLIDVLGITKLHAVVGGSFGGMQALQFATLFPERLDCVVSLCATAQTTPGSVAMRKVQRQAIMLDPDFQDGEYNRPGRKGDGPVGGMKVARTLAMQLYRSREEFDDRFAHDKKGEVGIDRDTFEVESYLTHKANSFTDKSPFDANCYLQLSSPDSLILKNSHAPN